MQYTTGKRACQESVLAFDKKPLLWYTSRRFKKSNKVKTNVCHDLFERHQATTQQRAGPPA
jgi:hypothetical protein